MPAPKNNHSVKQQPLPLEASLLDALPLLVMLVGKAQQLHFLNKSAQDFWGNKPTLPRPLLSLIQRVNENGESVTAHDFAFIHNLQEHRATVHLIPSSSRGELMIVIDLKGTPHAPSASAWKQEVTRSAGVMAAMLAHEVKNPLSSIRGAAQLMRDELSEDHKPLAELICNESLRIRDLLDKMEIFSDERQPELALLNIHEVLQYALQVAKAGFAAQVKFVERYDPSLPLVLAQRELLVQMFLNLIKNAAEAMSDQKHPTITLTTGYKSGYRLRGKELPVFVQVSDNGSGVPAQIRAKLFEPFATSKQQGRGLGLAVVAKIASDIGAVVELDERQEQGAGFMVYLAMS